MVSLLALPKTDNKWIRRYSILLKIQGNIYAGIFFVGYLVKWGVAWHDAGEPFNLALSLIHI